MNILKSVPVQTNFAPESLQVAFQIFLHRYLQQERVALVTPVMAEGHTYLSVVVTDLKPEQKFADFSIHIQRTLKSERILLPDKDQLGDGSAPRFQVAFHAHPAEKYDLAGKLPGTILELECIWADSKTVFCWHYDPVWYKPDEMDRMAACFSVFLENLFADLEKPLVSISLLTADEQHALLVDWNNTNADYPRDVTIHAMIEAQVDRTPDAVAATLGEQKITYSELDRRANRIAQALIAAGVLPGTPVGLYIERDLDMLAAQIGILKAGAAYVALDTQYPRELLARLFSIIKLPMILTQSRLKEKLPANQAKILLLDDKTWLGAFPENRPAKSVRADSTAFIIFTSGSTGLPKGVVHTHRNMVARFHAAWHLAELNAADVVSQTSPLSSIDGVDEIFSPLMRGARLVMIPHQIVTDPHRLVETLEREVVTRIILVPSLLRIILALTEENLGQRLGKLTTWLIGGEPLTNSIARLFYQKLPQAKLINFYGLTEGDALSHLVRREIDYPVAPPIGRPIQNAKVYLLDEYLNPVPVGMSGEICIASEGMFREYDQRPDLNSQKWLRNPFITDADSAFSWLFRTGDIGRMLPDGEVEYVGRRDRMVKIRSFRVELGEVEAALYRHPAVKECVVTVHNSKSTKPENALTHQVQLIAYMVLASGQNASVKELRQFIRDILPDYAMPAAILTLDALPLSPNGKVDLEALPTLADSAVEFEQNLAAPRDAVETELVNLWSSLLQRYPVGIHDNFFDIGGDSLAAVDLMLRIEKRFQRNLPISVLLQAPTIAQLAEILADGHRPARWSSLVPIQPRGSRPPLFCVHAEGGVLFYYRFAQLMNAGDRPIYGVQARGMQSGDAPLFSVEEMAAHYIQEIRTVQPKGPYHLTAFCAGGMAVYEMARQLRKQGEEVAFVGLLDGYGHNYPELITGQTDAEYKLSSHLKSLKQRSWGDRLGYLWRRIRKRLIAMISSLFLKLHLPLTYLPPKMRYTYIAWMVDRVSENYYQGQTYDGNLVLFRAAIQPEGIQPDPYSGWKNMTTGKLEIVEVPGDHDSIMKEPHLTELVRLVEMHLGKLDPQ